MRLRLAPAALSVALAAPAARAQGAPTPAGPAVEQCGYDACALRVEPGGFFTRPVLLRGVSAERVQRAGFRGFDLEGVVQGSDSAARHARDYRASQTRASAAGLVGTALAVTALIVSQSDGDAPVMPYSVGASAVGLYAGFEARRAAAALSRSLWWHNRRVAAPR